MISKICPKCNRIMSYDPYFKADICRQCGATEQVSTIEITHKRIINSKIIRERKMVLSR